MLVSNSDDVVSIFGTLLPISLRLERNEECCCKESGVDQEIAGYIIVE